MAVDREKRPAGAVELRRRAEKRLKDQALAVSLPLSEHEAQRLVHELQVHQVELEMQNDELRHTRDDLEKLLEVYTDLYDFAPVGYVTLDSVGYIHAANLAAASLLGVERTQIEGRRFALFVTTEARPAFVTFLENVYLRRDRMSCEVALVKEGQLPVFVQIEAVAAASGIECRMAIIDISRRKQLEANLVILHGELATHVDQLEKANIDLEAFNYSVSHDLRGPLTIISGYCELIEDLYGNRLDSDPRGYIMEMHKGAQRMNLLIETLINFSRAKLNALNIESVDLSKLANEVITDLQLTEPQRPVVFRVAEGVTAHCDAKLMRVVLNNLIGNAWKFTGNSGETVIEFGRIEIDGKPGYFVRDNGSGFDMEQAAKLFIPFHRVHAHAVPGSGIGLATVERIVTRHGGRVWGESKPGGGATFFFSLE